MDFENGKNNSRWHLHSKKWNQKKYFHFSSECTDSDLLTTIKCNFLRFCSLCSFLSSKSIGERINAESITSYFDDGMNYENNSHRKIHRTLSKIKHSRHIVHTTKIRNNSTPFPFCRHYQYGYSFFVAIFHIFDPQMYSIRQLCSLFIIIL